MVVPPIFSTVLKDIVVIPSDEDAALARRGEAAGPGAARLRKLA
jgi:hypothetical protein